MVLMGSLYSYIIENRHLMNKEVPTHIPTLEWPWPPVLERYPDTIVVDQAFAESLASELRANQLISGTILLVTDELFLDAGYALNYNDYPELRPSFPGRYDIIISADRFDSKGGRINLTGSVGWPPGSLGQEGKKGDDAEYEPGTPLQGYPGHSGGDGGEGNVGGKGQNIMIFCEEILNIDIISNGGVGAHGGKGGRGGPGGMGSHGGLGEFKRAPPGNGGWGGKGGPGGMGGSAGKIELSYCNAPNGFVVSDHLKSAGGLGGAPGGKGDKGAGSDGPAWGNPPGDGDPGVAGISSIPEVNQLLDPRELKKRVAEALRLPIPE
jgi:hypothetical protein